jgi:hypothetical protein
MLSIIAEWVCLTRRCFGTYDLIAFLAVLIGYAISGEPTSETFYEHMRSFSCIFSWPSSGVIAYPLALDNKEKRRYHITYNGHYKLYGIFSDGNKGMVRLDKGATKINPTRMST